MIGMKNYVQFIATTTTGTQYDNYKNHNTINGTAEYDFWLC